MGYDASELHRRHSHLGNAVPLTGRWALKQYPAESCHDVSSGMLADFEIACFLEPTLQEASANRDPIRPDLEQPAP